jgi:hypothetical protein
MMGPDGSIEMLNPASLNVNLAQAPDGVLADLARHEDIARELSKGSVLVHGREDHIRAMAQRVRLGKTEQDRRRARRKAAAKSRARNRPGKG